MNDKGIIDLTKVSSGTIRHYVPLQFKKLNPKAIIPKYMTEGAACFDLFIPDGDFYVIDERTTVMVKTGLACAVPAGHVMLMFSRSGHGFKNGVRLANCVGVIDSDYRGEIMAAMRNDGDHIFTLAGGERFAQAMVLPVPVVSLMEVEELPETARGEGGFGSTG